MKTAKVERNNLAKLTQMSILIAIIILMAFTPLGYLKTPVIEITFITIPVVIGAIILGPAAGAFLGGVFGITSFVQCFGMSAFGAALLEINPIFTFIICMIPRILMGFLTGVIFKAISKMNKTNIISFGVASLSGALLNTILFMLTLVLLFWNTDYIQSMRADGQNVLAFAVAFVGFNGILEAIVTFIVGTGVSKALHSFLSKKK